MTDEPTQDQAQADQTTTDAVEETKPEAPTTEEATPEAPAEAPAETPVEEKKEEAPVKEPAEEKKEEKPASPEPSRGEPSGKFKDLIKDIESLSVADLAELVKELEDRFGVSAAMAMAAPAATAGAPGAEAAEEKSAYTVVLASGGDKKIDVIKAVREINPDLGLKEAKDLVEGAPKTLKENVKKEEAEEAKKKLEAAGATVELK